MLHLDIYLQQQQQKCFYMVRDSCLFFPSLVLLREMQLGFDADSFKQKAAEIMRGERVRKVWICILKKEKKGLGSPKASSL